MNKAYDPMIPSPDFSVRRAQWNEDGTALRMIRKTVFIEEQSVPEAEEWDDLDRSAQHVLALDANGEPIGTGRLTAEGKIGRMAVLQPWRGRGVGAAILRALLDWAKELCWREIKLHAQTHALEFYAGFGFQPCGEVFMEAGIAHQMMAVALAPDPVQRHG